MRRAEALEFNPDEIVPPFCLSVKCVLRTRVVSAIAMAFQLALKHEFTASNVRRYGSVDDGRLFRRELLTAIRYASRDPESFASDVASRLTSVDARAREFIRERLDEIVHDPLRYIRKIIESRAEVPATGWSVIADPEETMDPLLFNPKYVYYIVKYFMVQPPLFRFEIAFCGETECYPLPLGLYPGNAWTTLASEAMRRDLVDAVSSKYGATTLLNALIKLDIEEAAIVILPRRRPSVNLFVKVGEPREIAVKLARMQKEVAEYTTELMGDVLPKDLPEIRETDVLRAIDEALEEREDED